MSSCKRYILNKGGLYKCSSVKGTKTDCACLAGLNLKKEKWQFDNFSKPEYKLSEIIGEHYITVYKFNPKNFNFDIVFVEPEEWYDIQETPDMDDDTNAEEWYDIQETTEEMDTDDDTNENALMLKHFYQHISGLQSYYINGTFFDEVKYVTYGDSKGIDLVDGVIKQMPNIDIIQGIREHYGYFGIDSADQPYISKSKRPGSKQYLQSAPMLIKDGKILFTKDCFENKLFKWDPKANVVEGLNHASNPNPRSAICIDYNDDVLFVIVQGRENEGRGLDISQFTQVLSCFKVKDALNLDGGKSTNIMKYTLNGLTSERLFDPTDGGDGGVGRIVPNFIIASKKR